MIYLTCLLSSFLAVLLSFPTSLAASDLYLLRDIENDLVRIDTSTYAVESVGPLDFKSNSSGMAWYPPSGKLLVARVDPAKMDNNPDFYFIDPRTAKSEYLGAISLGTQTGWRGAGLTVDPLTGRVFLGHARSIYEIDLENLSATEIGTIPGELNPGNPEDRVSLESLAFDTKNHRLVSGSSNLEIDPRIFTIDPDTGEISQLCTIVLPEGYSSFNDEWKGFHSGGLVYDPARNSYWRAGRFEPLLELTVEDGCQFTVKEAAVTTDAMALLPSFEINQGLNDAWYNPITNGQGLLLIVFPDIQQMFAAWFTYDTVRPPEDVTAMLGEPGHRWLTAQGPYDGDIATLKIYVTKGGVFDSAAPVAEADPAGDGALTLEFADCANGLMSYEITSVGISGEIPIQRIAPDNIELCEILGGQ